MISMCQYIHESKEETDPELEKMLQSSKVKRFVSLSEKKLNNELSKREEKEMTSLFDDPEIKAYIKAAEKVGVRNGWIKGTPIGAGIGLISGAIIGGAALAVLGAIAGGFSLGYLFAKANKILARWKAEDAVSSGAKAPETRRVKLV